VHGVYVLKRKGKWTKMKHTGVTAYTNIWPPVHPGGGRCMAEGVYPGYNFEKLVNSKTQWLSLLSGGGNSLDTVGGFLFRGRKHNFLICEYRG